MKDIFRAMRPGHWIKNAVVLAAFLFAIGDPDQASKLSLPWISPLVALAAAALFCLVSSGIYVMNDIVDIPLDRAHPLKKSRPIASGAVTRGQATVMSVLLLAAGVTGSYFLAPGLAAVAAVYVLIQAAYSLRLKRVALLDVMVIASGFVLRALAGAVALDVTISPWLVLCTFLLALFLGFCKRRHEKILLADLSGENRPSLENYEEKLLDQLIAVVSAATIVSYALYTLSQDTVAKFGSAKMGLTIPFVIFGVFRYLDLVYRHEKGNRPERILLTDRPLLIDMALYGITVLCVVLHSSGRG